jgi:uncharacterized membrane protein
MLRKLNKLYPLQLELIPLFLILLMVYITLSNYSILPDRIPTHFDMQGIPDQIGSKNEILIYLGSGILVYVLITGIGTAIAVTKDPKKLINLPERIKDALTPELAEQLRQTLERYLFAVKALIMGMDAYLLYSNIEVAFNRSSGLGYWPLIFLGLIVIVVLSMLYRIFRIV